MENIKQYVYDFIEGRVRPMDFVAETKQNPTIFDWVQSIVPTGKTMSRVIQDDPEHPWMQYHFIDVPYEIREKAVQLQHGRGTTYIGYHLNLQGELNRILSAAFPDNPPTMDSALSDLFSFMLEVCPEYIGGCEVDKSGIMEEIFNSVPIGVSKTAGKKWAKEEIKRRFHIEGRHRPYWIQEPEWPMYNGEPMEYVKTVRDNPEYQTLIFRDPKTGTERTVFDAH